MEDKQSPTAAETEREDDSTRPYWIPAGVEFESLPEELQLAITTLINPVYRELVLGAEDGLSQSSGMTLVFLMLLEVLDQIQLGAELTTTDLDEDAQKKRETLIARHLRTVGAKSKTSNLLIRIHEFRQKCGAFPPEPDPFRGKIPR